MLTTLAVSTIISFALSIACFRIAGDAKTAQLRWMDLMENFDLGPSIARRESQQRQFSWMFSLLCALLLALSGSCCYWTVVEFKEARREKTPIELELEMGRLEVAEIGKRLAR